MAAESKMKNPILKENLCCIFFFLLLPLFALIQNYSPLGIAVFAAAALFLVLRFGVFDRPADQVVIAHFGWYLSVSLLAVIGINLFWTLKIYVSFSAMLREFEQMIEPEGYLFSSTEAGFLFFGGIALLISRRFFAPKGAKTSGRMFYRRLVSHLVLAAYFYIASAFYVVQPNQLVTLRLLYLALFGFFLFCDVYRQYREKITRKGSALGSAAMIYVVIWAVMMLFRLTSATELLWEMCLLPLRQLLGTSLLTIAIPLLYVVVTLIVCWKGSFASQEVRLCGVYVFFLLLMEALLSSNQITLGWLAPAIHSAVFLFAVFYTRGAGGALEVKFSAHKEYKTAYSGITMFLCLLLLRYELYLSAVVLLAYAVILIFILTRDALKVTNTRVWEAIVFGVSLFTLSIYISGGAPMVFCLGCGIIWLFTTAALELFGKHSVSKKPDLVLQAGLGAVGIVLQVVLLVQWL